MNPTLKDISEVADAFRPFAAAYERLMGRRPKGTFRAPSGAWLAKAQAATGGHIERSIKNEKTAVLSLEYRGICFTCEVPASTRLEIPR